MKRTCYKDMTFKKPRMILRYVGLIDRVSCNGYAVVTKVQSKMIMSLGIPITTKGNCTADLVCDISNDAMPIK